MNCIMERKTRVAGLFLIGFALSLAGTGERTVTLDAPAGIAAGIVLGALGPAPLAAQNGNGTGGGDPEITCGWCRQFPWAQGTAHECVDEAGDQCLAAGKPSEPSQGFVECSRCTPGAPTDSCHTEWEFPGVSEGPCHFECGSNGNGNGNGDGNGPDFAQAMEALSEGLSTGDLTLLATVLEQSAQVAMTRYLPEGGRITVSKSCDLGTPAAQFPVALGLRSELAALFSDE